MSKMLKSAAMVMVLVALASGTAIAGGPRDTKSVTVHYGDLNLAHPADRATLQARLTDAAKKVCSRPEDDIKDRDRREDRKRCIAQALDRAYASINVNRQYVQVTK